MTDFYFGDFFLGLGLGMVFMFFLLRWAVLRMKKNLKERG
jgi:hypothetical protein